MKPFKENERFIQRTGVSGYGVNRSISLREISLKGNERFTEKTSPFQLKLPQS